MKGTTILSFVTLMKGVVFDTTNTEGRMIHSLSGACLAFDPIATVLLQAGLECSTKRETIAYVHTRIEASDEQLEGGLQQVIQQLLALQLIRVEQREELPPSITTPFQLDEDTTSHHVSSSPPVISQPHKQRVLKRSSVHWDVFFTGKLVNEPLPSFSQRRRGYALWNTICVLFIFGCYRLVTYLLIQGHLYKLAQHIHEQEWSNICQFLTSLPCPPKTELLSLDTEMLQRLARRELVSCQMIVRLLAPTALCLVRSVAFCTYLRALGFPSQVIMGRERYGISDRFAFHAWVELADWVVNDNDELRTGYSVIQRVPSDA